MLAPFTMQAPGRPRHGLAQLLLDGAPIDRSLSPLGKLRALLMLIIRDWFATPPLELACHQQPGVCIGPMPIESCILRQCARSRPVDSQPASARAGSPALQRKLAASTRQSSVSSCGHLSSKPSESELEDVPLTPSTASMAGIVDGVPRTSSAGQTQPQPATLPTMPSLWDPPPLTPLEPTAKRDAFELAGATGANTVHEKGTSKSAGADSRPSEATSAVAAPHAHPSPTSSQVAPRASPPPLPTATTGDASSSDSSDEATDTAPPMLGKSSSSGIARTKLQRAPSLQQLSAASQSPLASSPTSSWQRVCGLCGVAIEGQKNVFMLHDISYCTSECRLKACRLQAASGKEGASHSSYPAMPLSAEAPMPSRSHSCISNASSNCSSTNGSFTGLYATFRPWIT